MATKTPVRPLWYLGPGNVPVKHDKKPVARATHYCREGDDHWTPIEQQAKAPIDEAAAEF